MTNAQKAKYREVIKQAIDGKTLEELVNLYEATNADELSGMSTTSDLLMARIAIIDALATHEPERAAAFEESGEASPRRLLMEQEWKTWSVWVYDNDTEELVTTFELKALDDTAEDLEREYATDYAPGCRVEAVREHCPTRREVQSKKEHDAWSKQFFAKRSTTDLIKYMEAAPPFGYDDQEYELARRLGEQSKWWQWVTVNGRDRVQICDGFGDPVEMAVAA